MLKFGAVTYSNEYKIKLGVSDTTIEEYTVYSMEVAKEMSKCISNYANSDYGVGITGKLNRADKFNPLYKNDNTVYISIYNKAKDEFDCFEHIAIKSTREENKEDIINLIVEEMLKEL